MDCEVLFLCCLTANKYFVSVTVLFFVYVQYFIKQRKSKKQKQLLVK